MAGPAKQLQEKRKELEEVKEKAQEQLEKVHEVKRVAYQLITLTVDVHIGLHVLLLAIKAHTFFQSVAVFNQMQNADRMQTVAARSSCRTYCIASMWAATTRPSLLDAVVPQQYRMGARQCLLRCVLLVAAPARIAMLC